MNKLASTTSRAPYVGALPFLLASLVSWLVFILPLCLDVPNNLGRFFSFYSLPLFVLLLVVFALAYRLPEKWRLPLVFCVGMLLYALPLAYRWSSGYSDAAIIGGLLPYKDSYHYYNGARILLLGQQMPTYTLQAAWRPLFPGFLSSLLALVGNNFQWALAGLTGLLGYCALLSGELFYRRLGKWPAALYTVLLFLYVQRMIGYPSTELLGLAAGCLALILIWEGGQAGRLSHILWGIGVLMAAVSIRAGAFFVFPMLVLWLGWRFRAEKRFNWAVAGLGLLTVAVSFLFFNWAVPRLLVEPGGMTNGQFAYTIYGQVMGGTSWIRALTELGTTDPSVVYRAALEAFLSHPHSLLIAAVKSYRDFLLPNHLGIFSFVSPAGRNLGDILVWSLGLVALVWGCVRAWRTRREPMPALLLAVLIGIFLSIPFLPPIDGGRRFHASTVPFFFALVVYSVAGLAQLSQAAKPPVEMKRIRSFASGLAGVILLLTVIVPLGMLASQKLASVKLASARPDFVQTPVVETPVCAAGLVPVAVVVNPGAYIDLVPEGAGACGRAPQVCLQEFLENGREKSIDDFYQRIVALEQESGGILRLLPGNDLLQRNLHYYAGPPELLGSSDLPQRISGCAREINTEHQSIYLLESILPEG